MTIRVQMPLGTSGVSACGQSYTADDEGIVEVDHAEHVAPLVNLGGIELGRDGRPGTTPSLIGTDTLPALVDVRGGEEPMQLGTLVADAHARTSISVDQWNNLPSQIRDILIHFHLAHLRGELGNVGDLQTQLSEARSDVERLEKDLESANQRITELQGSTQTGDGGPAPDADVVERPDFEAMTKAQLNDWVVANGGTEIPPGDKDSHVAAAQARWLKLHPAQ